MNNNKCELCNNSDTLLHEDNGKWYCRECLIELWDK